MALYYWNKYNAQANYTTSYTQENWVYLGEQTASSAYGYPSYNHNSSTGQYTVSGSQTYTTYATGGTWYFGGGSTIMRFSWINSTKYGYSERTSTPIQTFSHYSQGTFVTQTIEDYSAHVSNAYESDTGYWWVRGSEYVEAPPPPSSPVQIGQCRIKTTSAIITLPIYDPNQFMTGKNQLRMYLGIKGVGAFMLVETNDVKASPLRVRTNNGTKAIAKL